MYKKLLLINRNFLIKGSLWLPLIFFFDITFAQQNLVPNPSFEQYTTCPQGVRYEHPDFWFPPDKGGGISMLVES